MLRNIAYRDVAPAAGQADQRGVVLREGTASIGVTPYRNFDVHPICNVTGPPGGGSFAIIVAMIRLYSLFMLLDLALLVVALIDCLSAEEYAIRALPRVAWVFLILLFSPIGAIAWFVAGRPARPVRLSNGEMWRPGSGFPEDERPRRQAPVAPDDDPVFLKSLAKSRKEDEEMMKRWEADLRRREEELRNREGDDD